MTRVPSEPSGPQEEPRKPPEFEVVFRPPPFENEEPLPSRARRRVRTRLWEEIDD
jgi:hypothetical protein